METDSEIRLWKGAKVVARFGVLCSHVDEYGTERQFPDELVLVGFQDTHKTEILGRDLGIKVTLKYGVRHLVTKDDEPTTVDTK